jgi:hypothetical protein
MPCHGDVASLVQEGKLAAPADCPHCAGEAESGSCHCCGQTAPSGIECRLDGLKTGRIPLTVGGAAPVDPLPESPPGRLFRPPRLPA